MNTFVEPNPFAYATVRNNRVANKSYINAYPHRLHRRTSHHQTWIDQEAAGAHETQFRSYPIRPIPQEPDHIQLGII